MKHDFRIEGLVMKASVLPNVDFKTIAKKLAEDIDSCKDKGHIYRDLYRYIHNNHLQSDECEKFIELLSDSDVRLWTLEETNLVAKKLDIEFAKKPYTPEEFRATMYLIRYDIDNPLKDSNIAIDSSAYGRLADHYLTTGDGTYKLIHEYFHRLMH